MSVYYNQTNQAPGTTQFITRAEVGQALSTIAGDLSGANISSLFYSPNLTLSTITMNPSGSIQGGSLVQANNALGVSSVLATYNRLFPNLSDPFILGLRNNPGSSYTNLAMSGLYVKPNTFATEPCQYITGSQSGFQTSLASLYPVQSWNSATNSVGLSNISSINGNPPTGATTFTNLTGSNLTTTGTLTAPMIVGVSSINGVPYSAPLSTGWSGSQSITLTSGSPATIATITLPGGYLQANQTYLYDVPIIYVSSQPGSPSGFVCNLGIRLGGNGQINYQIPLTIFPTTQGMQVNLTGIAQTNTTTLTAQTIEIIAVQSSGVAFQGVWAAPVSSGGLNVYTIRPLS